MHDDAGPGQALQQLANKIVSGTVGKTATQNHSFERFVQDGSRGCQRRHRKSLHALPTETDVHDFTNCRFILDEQNTKRFVIH